MVFAELTTLNAQPRSVLSHLRTLHSKMFWFQTRATKDIEDMYPIFYPALVGLLSDLAAAQRRGIRVSLNESVDLLKETLAAFEAALAESFPNIAGSSSTYQKIVSLCIRSFVLTCHGCNSTGFRLLKVLISISADSVAVHMAY